MSDVQGDTTVNLRVHLQINGEWEVCDGDTQMKVVDEDGTVLRMLASEMVVGLTILDADGEQLVIENVRKQHYNKRTIVFHFDNIVMPSFIVPATANIEVFINGERQIVLADEVEIGEKIQILDEWRIVTRVEESFDEDMARIAAFTEDDHDNDMRDYIGKLKDGTLPSPEDEINNDIPVETAADLNVVDEDDITKEAIQQLTREAQPLVSSGTWQPVVSKEQSISQPISRDDLYSIIGKLEVGKAEGNIWDILAASLAAEQVDRVVNRFKYRDQIINLVNQLARTVKILTIIGHDFGLTIYDEPVEESFDFAKWNIKRTEQLGSAIIAHAGTLIRQHATAEANLALANKQHETDLEKSKKIEDRSASDNTQAEETIAVIRRSLAHSNQLLASYTDQPMWVVCIIDPVDGSIKRFFKEEDDQIKSISSLTGATRFNTETAARDFRAELVRTMSRKANKLKSMSIRDTIVIQQISLFRVATDDYGTD